MKRYIASFAIASIVVPVTILGTELPGFSQVSNNAAGGNTGISQVNGGNATALQVLNPAGQVIINYANFSIPTATAAPYATLNLGFSNTSQLLNLVQTSSWAPIGTTILPNAYIGTSTVRTTTGDAFTKSSGKVPGYTGSKFQKKAN